VVEPEVEVETTRLQAPRLYYSVVVDHLDHGLLDLETIHGLVLDHDLLL
jgi:hypothetical protein